MGLKIARVLTILSNNTMESREDNEGSLGKDLFHVGVSLFACFIEKIALFGCTMYYDMRNDSANSLMD